MIIVVLFVLMKTIVDVIDSCIDRGCLRIRLSGNGYRTVCRMMGILVILPEMVKYRGAVIRRY